MDVQDRKVLERKSRLQVGYPSDGLTFGQRLKFLRHSKRWSQNRLAFQMRPQVSGNFISDIETGKSSPQLERIKSIATALGVDELYLTYGYEPDATESLHTQVEPAVEHVAEQLTDDIFQPTFTPIQPAGQPTPQQPIPSPIQDDDEPSDNPSEENGEPTFRVKVQRDGPGVIISFYFDQ